MSKLSTADVTKFLATDPEVQQMIKERYYDLDSDDYDDEEKGRVARIILDGANPKKWKRRNKYNVGSKTDMEGGDSDNCEHAGQYSGMRYGEHKAFAGGIVRIFWLEGTDHLTLAILEKDGQLKVIDDLSD